MAWSIEPYTEIGQRVQSPDLTPVIQEIIDQPGWAAGNGLVLIIADDPDNPSTGLRESEAGPGDDSATLVIEAFIPYARDPVPADGAVEVKDLTAAQWSAADGAVSYNVYISGDPTIEEDELVASVTDPEFVLPEAPLPGATYYWRVDAVDANDVVYEGPVWNLTTYPLEAHFPSPVDGQLWVKTDASLSWTEGLGALVHNVFLSTDQALVDAKDPNAQVGQWVSVPEFNPGPLSPNTTYYWAVDEFLGATTNPGPTWSFTTGDPNDGGVLAQYWDNQNLEGAPALVTTESEVNWNFNNERNSQPHPDVPVTDHFSARWTADLQVPATGAYTFYVASDDGSRLFLNGEEIIGTNWSDHGTREAASEPLELTAGDPYLLEMDMYENGGGATAYLRWEGPGIPKQIIPQGALQIPEFPLYPTPADGATGVNDSALLSWIPGPSVVQHDVYMGTDMDLVAAGDDSVYMGRVGVPDGVDIVVPDAGFDDHPLPNVGDWMYLGDPNYTGAWLNRLPGSAAWIDNGYFAADGDLPALSGTNKLYATYPEGTEDYVYQILDETFIEGATYTFSVWTGVAWDGYSDGWSLKLMADDPDNNVAEASGTAPVGTWEQVSLVYTATADDAGKKIGIKIETTAEYVTFDDVTLSYTPPISSFDPGLLPWNTNYYWRVDAVDADGAVTPAWSVWEFTTQADQVVEDFGSYDIDPIAPVTGPIAEYLFDVDASDTSGSELHGTLVDGLIVPYGDANEASALQLERGNYVDLGNPPELDFSTGDWTISAWVNTTMTGTGDDNKGTIYAKGGDTGGGHRIALIVSERHEGSVTLVCDDDSNKRQAHSQTPINDGQWHHVLGQREGTEIRIFIDGVLKKTTSVDADYDLSGTVQHNAYIGAVTDHNSDGESPLYKFYGGLIDEVRVYDYALAAEEIASFVPSDNLVSGAWGAGVIVSDPNEGPIMCLADGEEGSLALDADVKGADTLAVLAMGDGQIGVTVEDAAGAQNTVNAAAPADWQPVLVPLGGLDTAALVKITITATGGSVCVAELKATADHQVILTNPSFEQPGGIKKPGFGDVPGWSTDSEPIASGVEPGYKPTDGNYTAYLKGRDPAIWNLTNQTIRAAGETFILNLDARRIVTGSKYDGAQKLTIVLYYDDNGTRVPLATKTVGLKTGMKSFTVTFTAPADSDAIGKTLGIELSNKVSLWVGVDNLSLVRKYLDGVD